MLRYAGEIITLNKGTENAVKVRQVNKTVARKHYENGKTVWFHAANMRIDNMWQTPCPVNKNDTPEPFVKSFEGAVYDFMRACCDRERGEYPIYFIQVE